MISSSSQLGGGTKHMFTLGRNLDENYEVYYGLPKNQNFSRFLNSDNHINISERRITFHDIYCIFKFVSTYSIDIIHAHGKGAGLLARIVNLFAKKKLIYTFHGIHYKCHNFLTRIIYLIYENLTGRIDSYKILVSKSEKRFAQSLNIYLGNNAFVINNGVSEKLIKEFSKIKTNNFEKLMFEKITVVTVCRFVMQKNIPEIVNIARLLPNINFLIIGDGELWENIKSKISVLNIKNVYLLGRKKNVFKYLYNADIYLSTSLYEGLPISILEAMSIGLPIIASNVIGNSDAIEHGRSGYLYDLNNVDMAAEYINNLSKDISLREKMGKNCFKRQRKNFSLKKMILNYQKLYKICIS